MISLPTITLKLITTEQKIDMLLSCQFHNKTSTEDECPSFSKRFHSFTLFSNTCSSQKTSKCDKNISDTLGMAIASCGTCFRTTF